MRERRSRVDEGRRESMTAANTYSLRFLADQTSLAAPAAFHSQFLLAKNGREPPEHWMVRTHNGWRLATHPALPVGELALDGRPAGWVLGWPIAADRFVEREYTVPALPGEAIPAGIERFIYTLGGRFAAVLLQGDTARFYLDPFGSLAAVYAVEGDAVASTATLLVDQRELLRHYERMQREPGFKYFPAGLTASPRVRRLMPNHYLDLDHWSVVRHWPTADIERDSNSEEHVGRFFTTLQQNLTACLRARVCYIGVTSGRDSRMQLAAVPERLRDRVRCFTFDYGWRRRLFWADLHTGRALARRLGYPWQRVPVRGRLAPEAETNYLNAIGYAGGPGKGRDFRHAAARSLDLNAGWLTGFGGEVRIGYYWRTGDREDATLGADNLLDRLSLNRTAESLEAMAGWLESVRQFDAFLSLDLLYLEQRVACWAMPHLYGMAPFALNVLPLSHRHVVASAYSIDVEYRRPNAFARAVVDRGDSRLRGVPFGTFLGPAGVPKRYLTGALQRMGLIG